MGQNLSALFTITDRYTTTIQKIMKSQDSFEKKQRQVDKTTQGFNKRMENMKQSSHVGVAGVDNLTSKLTGLVSAAYLAKKALDATFSGIKTSATQKLQQTTFQALVHSKEAGENIYKYVSAYAKVSALGRQEISAGMNTYLTATRDIDQIEQLIKMTERLYAKDPTQGAEGAVFALKEALEGDTLSLRNRFGISGLSGEKLRDADITGKIAMIDAALNKFGATQEVVDANYTNLITQTNMFASNLKDAIGEAATPVMENLAQTAMRLNEEMQAGKYQPFIALMVSGMEMIGNGIAFVAENANWLIPVIGGVVIGLVSYKAATMAATLWTTLASIAVNGLTGNWAGAIGVIAGVTAGMWSLSKAMQSVDSKFDSPDVSEFKKAAGEALNNTKLSKTLPVEVTNTDPVKVTGEVDIEKENLKYLMDIAGAKFFAKFSTATLAPQVNIYGQTIEKTADADEVLGHVVNGLSQATSANAQGEYSFA